MRRNADIRKTFAKGIDELLTTLLSSPAAPIPSLRPGMRVVHEIFGEGTVLALEGEHLGARVQIQFGKKVGWYALSAGKVKPMVEGNEKGNPTT